MNMLKLLQSTFCYTTVHNRGTQCISTQVMFPHLSSTVFGVVIVCAVSAVVLLILWVLLTGWGSCNQHRENGLQDGAQQLLLQQSLESRERDKDFVFVIQVIIKLQRTLFLVELA